MICLVPELCYMTGLTEKSRQDFSLMKVGKPLTDQPGQTGQTALFQKVISVFPIRGVKVAQR